MNFLKKFLGSSPKDDLSMIPSGQLFLKRSLGSPKSASECLYTDAAASVRETSAPHNYQLVIQRAFAEGEEQLKGDDDEEEDDFAEFQDERVFLIDKSLKIHYFNRSGSLIVSWSNRDGDDGERFEFVVDESIKSSEVEHFMKTVYCCEFERKYSKSSAGVTTEQLDEFVFDPESESIEATLSKSIGNTPTKNLLSVRSEDEGEDSIYEDAEEVTGAAATSPIPSRVSQPATPKKDDLVKKEVEQVKEPTGEEIVQVSAELRLYDPTTESFSLQDTDGTVTVLDLGKWEYWLSIKSKSGISLGTLITPKLNPVFNYEVVSFIFNYETGDDEVFSWLLRFEAPQELLEFQTGYMRAAWEAANKSKWQKAEASEKQYVLDAFNTNEEDQDMADYPEEEEEEEDEEQEKSSRAVNLRTGLRKEGFSDSEDEEEDEVKKNYFKGSQNKNLTIAFKNDRSYVTRGNRIGVFKTTDDDDLEFATAIENLSIGDKKQFSPTKMMLHTEDRSLVMQGDKKDTLYRMDLEYGKIVDEWKVKEDLPVVDFGPSKKFNQMTGEQTFLGISDKGLFKVDPRVNGDKLVESEYKTYATKNGFSSFGTTEDGFIAVASDKGDLRLYDRLGIRAKSLIPAIGDSIKFVETSADGKWLLATCQTYLILIDLTIKSGANAGSLGFKKSFGKDNVPKARTLKISPEHVASIKQLTGTPLNFSKAHFNTGINAKEQTIVSSSGPYAITWSLRKILRGDAEPYMIKRYSSNVVADNFKFGTDKNVIVALDDDVGIVNKKAFRKADRQTLAYVPREGFF